MKKYSLPRLAGFTVIFLASLPAGLAQVEHKREWSPVRESHASAPPPEHLSERVREFEERNSPESVAKLAGQLFGLINPAFVPEKENQALLYRKAWEHFRAGMFSEALEAYKAFSFERFRHPATGVKIDPADPAQRIFIEFYNTPDELMRGIFASRFLTNQSRMKSGIRGPTRSSITSAPGNIMPTWWMWFCRMVCQVG